MKFTEEDFRAFHTGENWIIEKIVLEFSAQIIGYISLFTADRDLAEEIAQEVFLRVYVNREKFKRNENFRAWLFKISHNMTIQEFRKRYRKWEIAVDGGEDTDKAGVHAVSGTKPDEQFKSVESRRILMKGIKTLDDTDSQIMLLRYFLNFSIEEISKTLGVPMGTVGVKIQRSLSKLKGYFLNNGFKSEDFL